MSIISLWWGYFQLCKHNLISPVYKWFCIRWLPGCWDEMRATAASSLRVGMKPSVEPCAHYEPLWNKNAEIIVGIMWFRREKVLARARSSPLKTCRLNKSIKRCERGIDFFSLELGLRGIFISTKETRRASVMTSARSVIRWLKLGLGRKTIINLSLQRPLQPGTVPTGLWKDQMEKH